MSIRLTVLYFKLITNRAQISPAVPTLGLVCTVFRRSHSALAGRGLCFLTDRKKCQVSIDFQSYFERSNIIDQDLLFYGYSCNNFMFMTLT